MKIRDIVKLTNTYLTGEQLVYQKLVPFYDAVIDDINSRLNSTYPSFSELDITSLDGDKAVYNFFPDRYVRSVVALGAAHKFYTMDEEGVAYDSTYEDEYERNLFYMTRDYIEEVPEMFQSESTGSVRMYGYPHDMMPQRDHLSPPYPYVDEHDHHPHPVHNPYNICDDPFHF